MALIISCLKKSGTKRRQRPPGSCRRPPHTAGRSRFTSGMISIWAIALNAKHFGKAKAGPQIYVGILHQKDDEEIDEYLNYFLFMVSPG